MALSVAAVVVANPVISPRPDLQIPAFKVKLSGTGDAMDMLNSDFISAIGPTPAESSSNPFVVLKDLIASLAADATYLGRSAIVAAFFAGATAVTNPELTAASYPYVPPPVVPAGPGVWSAPITPAIAAVGPLSAEQLLAIAALPADLVPAAAEAVMTLLDDVRDLGDGAVTAAFAAGALVAAEGGQVIDALRGLVDNDVQTVLTNVLAAVGSGDPQRAIISALRDVIEEPAAGVQESVGRRPVVAPPAESPSTGESATPDAGLPPASVPSADALGAQRVPRQRAVLDGPAVPPGPAFGKVAAEVSLPEVFKGDLVKNDLVKDFATPADPARNPVRPGPLNGAVTEIGKQAQGILRDAADAVRKLDDRPVKAPAGPTGD